MRSRSCNLSDSSDSFLSDEEVQRKEEVKKNQSKKRRLEDRATSKFYTKDDSQEDLPYVANNVFKIKGAKKSKYKKASSHSNSKLSCEVNFFTILFFFSEKLFLF